MGTMTVLMAMIRWRWCASIIDRWRLQKKQPQGTLQGDSVVFETVQVLMVYNIFAMVYITFAIQWCLQYIQYLCSGAQQFLKKKQQNETLLQGDSRCWFSQFAIPSQSMKESIANYKCFELFRKRWQRLRISQRHCHGHGSGGVA